MNSDEFKINSPNLDLFSHSVLIFELPKNDLRNEQALFEHPEQGGAFKQDEGQLTSAFEVATNLLGEAPDILVFECNQA